MKMYLTILLFSFNLYANPNFIDKYGRVHDQVVENGESSSDNGWLYSAVYKKLGGTLQLDESVAMYCVEKKQRHPKTVGNREDIPISRDEILGLAYLGYLKPQHLDGWNFSPYPKEEFNLIKFIKQALELVDSFYPFKLKHRNYFWKNRLNQIDHIAFSVPLQDRYFILQQWGQYNLVYHIVHEINSKLPTSDRSSRQINFLKNSSDIESVLNYYQHENHPSVLKVKEKLARKN
jgi:hypothetical protein